MYVVSNTRFFSNSEDTPKKSKKKRERTPDPTDPVVIAERAAEHTAEALAEAEARAKAEEESKPSKIEECKYYTSLTLGMCKIFRVENLKTASFCALHHPVKLVDFLNTARLATLNTKYSYASVLLFSLLRKIHFPLQEPYVLSAYLPFCSWYPSYSTRPFQP